MPKIEYDTDLIKRYNKAGPRYTSYPTAIQFNDQYTEDSYREYVEKSNQSDRALSLYFHIPFCDTVCFYCGCNKVVTKDRTKAAPYLQRLHKEIEMQFRIKLKITRKLISDHNYACIIKTNETLS